MEQVWRTKVSHYNTLCCKISTERRLCHTRILDCKHETCLGTFDQCSTTLDQVVQYDNMAVLHFACNSQMPIILFCCTIKCLANKAPCLSQRQSRKCKTYNYLSTHSSAHILWWQPSLNQGNCTTDDLELRGETLLANPGFQQHNLVNMWLIYTNFQVEAW